MQSGSSRILDLMSRGYTREWYLNKVNRIKEILGESCGISSDMISGFCSETEAEHEETLSLMDIVQYDYAYMFAYSERPGTPAAKKYADDVANDIKTRRLDEIITKQRNHSLVRYKQDVGTLQRVLIEGQSRRSEGHWQGRTSANRVVVFEKANSQKGEYVNVKIESCTSGTLLGKIVN